MLLGIWAESNGFTKKQAAILLSQITGATPVVSSSNLEDIKHFGHGSRSVLREEQKGDLKFIATTMEL